MFIPVHFLRCSAYSTIAIEDRFNNIRNKHAWFKNNYYNYAFNTNI